MKFTNPFKMNTKETKKEQENIENQNITAEETKDKKEEVKKETKEETKAEKTDLELLEEKNLLLNDKYLRLSAEFDNYRKRTLKEKIELTKTAGQDILSKLLPIVDDFNRAIESTTEVKDIEAVKLGVDLIFGKFNEFLKQNGVKEIDALHKDFDTDVHEALTKIPATEKKLKGKVVDVIEKGYFLNEKVIRFAKVVVGE